MLSALLPENDATWIPATVTFDTKTLPLFLLLFYSSQPLISGGGGNALGAATVQHSRPVQSILKFPRQSYAEFSVFQKCCFKTTQKSLNSSLVGPNIVWGCLVLLRKGAAWFGGSIMDLCLVTHSRTGPSLCKMYCLATIHHSSITKNKWDFLEEFW